MVNYNPTALTKVIAISSLSLAAAAGGGGAISSSSSSSLAFTTPSTIQTGYGRLINPGKITKTTKTKAKTTFLMVKPHPSNERKSKLVNGGIVGVGSGSDGASSNNAGIAVGITPIDSSSSSTTLMTTMVTTSTASTTSTSTMTQPQELPLEEQITSTTATAMAKATATGTNIVLSSPKEEAEEKEEKESINIDDESLIAQVMQEKNKAEVEMKEERMKEEEEEKNKKKEDKETIEESQTMMTSTTKTKTAAAAAAAAAVGLMMKENENEDISQTDKKTSLSTTTTTATMVLDMDSMDKKEKATISSLKEVQVPTKEEKDVVDDQSEQQQYGAMIDLENIAFSGLKGQALSLRNDDFPSLAKVKSIIPKDCFEPNTATSLGYLGISLLGTTLCTAFGISLLNAIGTSSVITLPIWTLYSVVTGTVAMGLWVLAHECGHGAFSKNKALQDTVGYILHSFLLVPYFSWQRSHAVHHRYTNHAELGETHVPEKMINVDPAEGETKEFDSYEARKLVVDTFGLNAWGVLQSFAHLVIGWPAYLLIGATGADVNIRGMTNHFYPHPLPFVKVDAQYNKDELFPGKWKEKVWQSDVGIALTLGGLVGWGLNSGWGDVMALYGGPLLIVNAWLVLYTWLQHTDVDVPHFSSNNHNFVKGAFHTIDRPYDKLDPFGIIDFLHHKIGSTHVAHHLDCTIPHYKARLATDCIKKEYPDLYLYDDTPIFQAMWRIARGCTAVKKTKEGMWIWDNEGLEKDLMKGGRSINTFSVVK